jgi:hypothetical protein
MNRAFVLLVLLCSTVSAGRVSIGLDDIRAELESHKDQLTTLCAQEVPVPRTVTVAVTGHLTIDIASPTPQLTLSGPAIELTAKSDDMFAECFVREAQSLLSSDRFITSAFSGSITVNLRRPDALLGRTLDAWFEEDECRPRPGALPKSIAVNISSDDYELTVKVTTKPSNPVIDECAAASLRSALERARIDGGLWKPRARITRKLTPIFTDSNLRRELHDSARQAAASCIAPEIVHDVDAAVLQDLPAPRIGAMRVTAVAKLGASDFAVVARSGDKDRDECTAEAVTRALHELFERELDDATKHFRIDGNATASVSFAMETEMQLAEREAGERAPHPTHWGPSSGRQHSRPFRWVTR